MPNEDDVDEARGIYRKFEVKRPDGSSGPGGKHEHCAYFVLDLEHDEFALVALRAYAKAARRTHPFWVREWPKPTFWVRASMLVHRLSRFRRRRTGS